MYHTWMAAPKELYGWLNALQIHKVNQHPSVRKINMVYYQDVLKVWETVMAEQSQFAFGYVDTGI